MSGFDPGFSARRRLVSGLLLITPVCLLASLAAGGEGWSLSDTLSLLANGDGASIVGEIRAPRALGAWLAGALLALAGAVAQGLFRNPLADPYLLGSGSGAVLGVVLVLAASAGAVGSMPVSHLGLVAAAFLGAVGGVVLTMTLAQGAQQTIRLLLAGVVVGVLLGAISDLVTTAVPEALRGKQAFLLGSTAFLGWAQCVPMAVGLFVTLPWACLFARALDALTLGEDGAKSLGVAIGRARMTLVIALALATGVAVSQAGLIAFVGLVSPHVVRRLAPSAHRFVLLASAAVGGLLMVVADILARTVMAPLEIPVGVVTAVVGGAYLLWLLPRRRSA